MINNEILAVFNEKREMIPQFIIENDPNYLAYIADLGQLKKHPNGKLSLNIHLLHWAAGHPYPEYLEAKKMTIAIEQRLLLVNYLLSTVDRSSLYRRLSEKNYWGETVIHVAIASENMSDSDTLKLLQAWLAPLSHEERKQVLCQTTKIGATVLNYATYLKKSLTVAFIQHELAGYHFENKNVPVAVMEDVELQKYFKKIEIDLPLFLERMSNSRFAAFTELYFAHITHFAFQNFELRELATVHPLLRKELQRSHFWKLINSSEQGSFCFHLSGIFYEVAKKLGYNVERHLARVLNGAQPNSEAAMKMPATHLLLSLKIDGMQYYLDPGLGSRATRVPMLMNGQENNVQHHFDTVKLRQVNSSYVYSRSNGNGFTDIIQTDMKPADDQAVQFAMRKLSFFPTIEGRLIGIRDDKIAASIVTETGSLSLMYDTLNRKMFFIQEEHGKFEKSEVTNLDEAVLILMKKFNIRHISSTRLESFTHAASVAIADKAMTTERVMSLPF